MSCEISNGRLEQCKDSVSGIDSIFFINFGDYAYETDITYNATYPDQIDDINGVSSLYKYELKGANSFEQTINSSRENGTTFVEQVLTIQLKKQDSLTHKTVKLLSYGRPHIVIKTRNNQYFLMGVERGADLTAGTISTGVQMGDLSGYSLTFTAQENLAANILNCSSDSGLATLFSSATIVSA